VDVGSVIADTYTIEALIGQGGMGSVFLASHNRLPGKRVAIKLLHVELTDEDVIARFRREALIASQLDHPNIVRVDDYNVTPDGTPYLVLELLEGESLADRIKQGPMPLEQVLAVMRMVGSAIMVAHENGIIHRDLKPQNIFLVPTEIDGELVEGAKVLDFGISKMRGSSTVKTQESTLLGTPQYMAPEQATGSHAAVDERTDVFALGSIAYEMLTGQPAFSGENIPEVVFKVVYEQAAPLGDIAPPEVVAAIERAMQKKQEDRFASVTDFVEALTGRPLVQRSSMISMPPGARMAKPGTTTTGKRTGQAAFANTVDSGSVAKGAVSPGAVSPHAQTVASQDGDQVSPVAPSLRARETGSQRTVVIGLAIACILAGAIAIGYVVTRKDDSSKPAVVADAAVAMVDLDAAPVAAPDGSRTSDAAPIVVDAAEAVIDAAVAVTPDAKKPVVVQTGGTPNRNTGDPKAWEDIDAAEAAHEGGNTDLALKHCNSIENNPSASGVQRNIALLLRGTIHCIDKHDIGATQADLRAMTIAAYKQKLIARCPQLK
jgi:serine/threonine protein kinase